MLSAIARHPNALGRAEIQRLVYKYIGVFQGYLGDFTYRTHEEFYVGLDLDVDPSEHGSTTRERFVHILLTSPPDVQARILQGILDRYPVGTSELRTPAMAAEVRGWIAYLQGAAPVAAPNPRVTSEVVQRSLRDAEELIKTSGATSGVDRAHTALHGYLGAVCEAEGIKTGEDAAMPELLKAIRERHPAFRALGPRADDIMKVLRSLGSIVDALNPLRNKASVAHPNPALLAQPEAMLVINAARTILRYLDDRLHRHAPEDDLPF